MNDDAELTMHAVPKRSIAAWPMMLLILLAVGSLVAIQLRRPKPADPFAGVPLIRFSAEGWLNHEGAPTPEQLRGKLVLVDFWSTDCPNCVRETPKLAALRQQFQEDALAIVGLTPRQGRMMGADIL